MFPNRCRRLRRRREVRKVETDFVLVRLADAERVCVSVLGLSDDLDSGVDGGEVVEFYNVGVS